MVSFVAVLMWASVGAAEPCTPLHEAAMAGDVAKVRALLAGRMLGLVGEGADALDAPAGGDCRLRTPLMLAAENGHREVIVELLRRGAQPLVVVDDPLLGPMTAHCLALANLQSGTANLLEASGASAGFCVDSARLLGAMKSGNRWDVTVQLRSGDISQLAYARALEWSVGQRPLDSVRTTLINRLESRGDLAATARAARSDDVVALAQLALTGATLSSSVLPMETGLDDTRADLLTASLLDRLLVMAPTLTDGEVAKLVWHALFSDRPRTLQLLADRARPLYPWAVGEQGDLAPTPAAQYDESSWSERKHDVLDMALSCHDAPGAMRALLKLRVLPPSGAVLSRVEAAGDCEAVNVLHDAGAPLNQVDRFCRTPMEVARDSGHLGLFDALEKAVRGHPRVGNPFTVCAGTAEFDPKPPARLDCR